MGTSVTVKNPVAGHGGAMKKVTDSDAEYITKAVGDAEKYTFDLCSADPEAHITVCGGDGTINEVVNGILKAGAGKTSSLSVVPSGTGNDLVRCFSPGDRVCCDVGKYSDSYFINLLNIGLDCDVVAEVVDLKKNPLLSGSLAYIVGVIKCMFSGYGERMTVELEDEHGNVEKHDGEFLLLAVANGSYYGGGFNAAPLASMTDGLLDVLLVKKIPRYRFLEIILAYKKGEHFDRRTGSIKRKYSDVIHYRRCKRVKVENVSRICVDGEIEERSETEISVVPKAVNLVF